MALSALMLSIDSLIVAAALSPTVAPGRMAQLAVLFGLCDAGASLLGARMALSLPPPGLIAAAILALWLGLERFDRARNGRWSRSPVWAFLAPPLMAIDNLAGGGAAPASAGLASAAMAGAGFAIGLLLLRGLGVRGPDARWTWAPLGLAMILLAS